MTIEFKVNLIEDGNKAVYPSFDLSLAEMDEIADILRDADRHSIADRFGSMHFIAKNILKKEGA